MHFPAIVIAVLSTVATSPAWGQAPIATPVAATAHTSVPALVPYASTAMSSDNKPLTGEIGVTFLLFQNELGGEPMWTETQIVDFDLAGRYSVRLGATSPSGIPLHIFALGDARWLEVQIEGQKQQPRVLLMSVPYAAKAADAATLGGLPASAFALAGYPQSASATSAPTASPDASSTVTTSGGTSKYLPVFNGANSIANSQIYDNGTSVGIGDIPNPVAKLDINGPVIMRGSMTVSRTGNATAATGYPSYGFDFFSNAYNSSTKGTDNPHFQLQSEPAGNNTATTSATLNLLFSNHGTAPVETGLFVNPNGTINFAPGQTFAGAGTITGVIAGTGLIGGGTSGNVTVNVDATKLPLLASANNFVGTQSISGDLSLPATSSAASGVITINGVPFLQGFAAGKQNTFVGGAGNFTTTGSANTAAGYGALPGVSSGGTNTALGAASLQYNTTGSGNTGLGVSAGPDSASTGLTNATTVGYGATVSQSNTLVLGNTTTTPGQQFVNVGIGTATPTSILEASVNAPGALGPTLTLSNSSPNGTNAATGTSASIAFQTNPPATTSLNGPSSSITASHTTQYGDDLIFSSINQAFGGNHGTSPHQQANMIISATGQIQMSGTLTVGGSGPGTGFQQGYTGVLANGGGGFLGGGGGSDGGDGGQFFGGRGYTTDNGSDGGRFYGGDIVPPGASDQPNTSYGGDGIYTAPGQSDFVPGLPGNAATLDGDVSVTGTLSAATKDFKIDHPLDPANKFLVHSSVESSEMMNIYSGNVITDDLGIATVTLPEWFESLNTDFRYQLTTIGRDAHAWISQKVKDGKFMIGTNAPLVEVSWQITAVRQDAYAKAHPLVVEEQKPTSQRGFYLHPELYGQPAERQIEWSRHPEEMRRLKALREAQRMRLTNSAKPTVTASGGIPASAVRRVSPSAVNISQQSRSPK